MTNAIYSAILDIVKFGFCITTMIALIIIIYGGVNRVRAVQRQLRKLLYPRVKKTYKTYSIKTPMKRN